MKTPGSPGRRARLRTLLRRCAAVLALTFGLQAGTAGGAGAAIFVPLAASGSTWSALAMTGWIADVTKNGIEIKYTQNGSSAGRKDFSTGVSDFAVSEIPYGTVDNGQVDTPPARQYAYMPIVAGGTTFMYQLHIGRQLVTNLRLDGETITKIFTGVITKWNDPAIAAANPALANSLPNKDITPVVRTDGSGTTAQFSTWMAARYQSLWDAYCAKAGRATPCGTTSFYPLAGTNSGFISQTGSSGVAGYVAQPNGEGSITYVEYAYARDSGFPAVKLLNQGGYYTLPTPTNVAVALTGAKVHGIDDGTPKTDPAYLTQNLSGVYANPDPRTYPLSSYSYMIIPTVLEDGFTANKGYTLGTFAYHLLCDGQQQVSREGYSPLPINLVQAGFSQVTRVPGVAVQNINVAGCNNPTFSTDGTNTLVKTAAQPAACDKAGAQQCAADGQTAVPSGGASSGGGSSGGTSGGSGSGGGKSGSSGSGGGSSSGGSSSGGSASGGAASGGSGSGGAASGGSGGGANPIDLTSGGASGGGTTGGIDPNTGQSLDGGGTSTGSTGSINALPAASTSLAKNISSTLEQVLMGVAAMLLLGVVAGPPLLARSFTRRGDRR